jgi:hypothetical protein
MTRSTKLFMGDNLVAEEAHGIIGDDLLLPG